MWESAYSHVRYLYESIKDSFAIKHDNYGGYKLIYSGIESIPGRTVLPNEPKGILRIIPEDFTDLSVIYKVSDKETAYLMLGPIRFINSDCEPNCEYDFSSLDKTLVRLRTLKKLKTNDEVLLKYNDDFFSNHECKCRTCSVRERAALELQQPVLQTPVPSNEIIADSQPEVPMSLEPFQGRGHEIMDNMALHKTCNEFSPVAETLQEDRSPAKSQDGDHKSLADKDLQSNSKGTSSVAELLQEDLTARKKTRLRRHEKNRAYKDLMKEIKERSDKLIGDFDEADLLTSSADQVQCENVFDSPTTDSQVLVAQEPEDADTDYLEDLESASHLLATSSPLPIASMPGPPECCRFPSLPFVGASTPNSAEKTNFLSYEFNERRPILEENFFELPGGTFTPLYPSCRVGSNNAQVLIRAFTNHHKISDACQVDLLKLSETIMPILICCHLHLKVCRALNLTSKIYQQNLFLQQKVRLAY